jgi:methyl-accepting chemotaxis protein
VISHSTIYLIVDTLEHIKRRVNHMSQQIDALVTAFQSFSGLFATFAADATKALNDLVAKQADPGDQTKIQTVIDGLNAIALQVAALDNAVKAADAGATGPATPAEGGATPTA